jgi:hypothetical protein
MFLAKNTMSKPPEVVLCEVLNDDASTYIVTCLHRLEVSPVDDCRKAHRPNGELALVEQKAHTIKGANLKHAMKAKKLLRPHQPIWRQSAQGNRWTTLRNSIGEPMRSPASPKCRQTDELSYYIRP